MGLWNRPAAQGETFPSSKEFGVPRMYLERHISSEDHRYWVQYTVAFQTERDVVAALTANDVHKTIENAPENLVTLIEVLTMHLESLINDPLFAPVPAHNPGGLSALFASTAQRSKPDTRNRTLEALNCCRVLTRVIPFVYESTPGPRKDSDIHDLELRALWTPLLRGSPEALSPPTTPSPKLGNETAQEEIRATSGQFILTDGDESMLSNADKTSGRKDAVLEDMPAPRSHSNASKSVMTGHALLNTVMELLFHAGFTLPWTPEQLSVDDDENVSRVHFTIWEAGIGCSVDLENTTSAHMERRTEVMRLLISMLSKPMYTTPALLMQTQFTALDFIACDLERPVVLSFLCSLLNTISNYRQADRWSLVGARDLVRDIHTSVCFQVLGALLSYEDSSMNQVKKNMFRHYVMKLYRVSDFAFLATGISKVFGECMSETRGAFELGDTMNGMFVKPGEEHASELLAVLWIQLKINADFHRFITRSRQLSLDIFSWLMFVALANKDAAATLSQAQLAIFLLQDLTADRMFCVHLTSVQSLADLTIPTRYLRLHGEVAMDVLIEGVFTLFTKSNGLMTPMYPFLLLILFNAAPFWRNLSVISAARLEILLRQLSSPRFLLAEAGNPRLLGILLNAFSQMLQHQFSNNANVVYALVRSASVIDRLKSFSLEEALENIYRVRQYAANVNPMPQSKPLPDPAASEESKAQEEDTPEKIAGTNSKLESSSAQAEQASPFERPDDQADTKNATAQAPQSPALSKAQLDQVARSVGRNGFVPTNEWVESWHASLHLSVLGKALDELVPRVNSFCTDPNVANSANADEKILAYLREQTLAGVLSPVEETQSQPFVWNNDSYLWLQNYIWGIVYLAGLPLGVWTGTHTKLFNVRFEEAAGTTGSRVLDAIVNLTSGLMATAAQDVEKVAEHNANT
ncbi:hypothetical protein MVES1_000828 [Malassezia vespertilionis]|uniref:Uncharacterized protein n=1 Tax=Malassezia vespertilionis TaxID=2020962 RepID=A0A2N1JEY2_9BASI|nr:uncharacterized protein MVES1_000828 [Malassezia vespertilionis]PKI85111.1 hypothetical protein MVES_000776 [Malassezia vespertilionis]WFD05498.1 hypothetical protein MVES1_000828 [Malassezia vespertilionis]